MDHYATWALVLLLLSCCDESRMTVASDESVDSSATAVDTTEMEFETLDVGPDTNIEISGQDVIEMLISETCEQVPENIEETIFDDALDYFEIGEIHEIGEIGYDPWSFGPYQVGTTSFQWFDLTRLRPVPATAWYPAKPLGQPKATYLMVIQGKAYSQASPDLTGAPYPLVLFSHGFRGTSVQSITFTEFLASHGYVVVAMDHSGNTLTDFFSDDKKVAEVALERPNDVAFAYQQTINASATPGGFLTGMVDAKRVAVTGHSFGGYTALMVAGGQVDVDAAKAACAAGTPADIFCDYVGYWPSGKVIKFEKSLPGLKAAIALAPGGAGAFGPNGLSGVSVPVAVFSGTLDNTCPLEYEVEPIYQGLPTPKALGVVENASHMSYTNVCDIPLSDQFIKDYCGVPGMLGHEETFAIVNGVVVAWLGLYVKGDTIYKDFLDAQYLETRFSTFFWKYEQ